MFIVPGSVLWVFFLTKMSGDKQGIPLFMITMILAGFAYTAAFAFAFEELRSLVRPETGGLAQIANAAADTDAPFDKNAPFDNGEDAPVDAVDEDANTTPSITADAFASLRRWRKGVYSFAAVWCCFMVLMTLKTLGPGGNTDGGTTGEIMATVGFYFWLASNAALFATWYLSLRLACAMAGQGVEQVGPACYARRRFCPLASADLVPLSGVADVSVRMGNSSRDTFPPRPPLCSRQRTGTRWCVVLRSHSQRTRYRDFRAGAQRRPRSAPGFVASASA